jgi:hypothetical protein
LPVFVERDGLADVVHDDLAWIAASHVLLEFLADGRVNRAIHVFVQHRQHFFALHNTSLFKLSLQLVKGYKRFPAGALDWCDQSSVAFPQCGQRYNILLIIRY